MTPVEIENLIYDIGSEVNLEDARKYFGRMTVMDIIRDAHRLTGMPDMYWLNRFTGEVLDEHTASLSEFRRRAFNSSDVVTISEALFIFIIKAQEQSRWGLPDEKRD